MKQVAIVAFGGAAGSLLRYGVQKLLNAAFPFGTLAVNIVGCFLAGWLLALAAKELNLYFYLFLMTGFCGGFTTFSAFSVESLQLIIAGRWLLFSTYSFISIAGGFLATFTGFKIFST